MKATLPLTPNWAVATVLAGFALLGCSGNLFGGSSGSDPVGSAAGSASVGSTGGSSGQAGASSIASGAAVGPSSGRRLTKREYLNSVVDLLGVDLSAPDDAGLLSEDQPPTGAGFRNDIGGLLPTAVRTDAFEALAIRASERVAWASGLALHAACTDQTAECRAGFIRQLGRLLFRRVVTDADVQLFLPLFEVADQAQGFEAGARLVLQAMLQSPHFLYRLERLDSVDAASGRPAPSAFELATRLSYLTWQSAPTPALLEAAERGELGGASFAAAVQGALSHPNRKRGFEGYAQDWLQLYRLDRRTPNDELGVTPELIGEMKEETLRFVSRIALTEDRDLNALFTDKTTDLGPALAPIYGVAPPAQGFARFDLSGDSHRVGILTQPGFMILRAAPERATIVHRGLMVLRVFLCSEVPSPPANAATNLDSVPTNLTDRERFSLHTTAPTCKGCHAAFDPLGYAFEPYDLAGRFRNQDEFGNPLRSDGEVHLDDVTETFANTAEFANLLSKSARVQRCFVSKLFQYGMGRTLQGSDESAVDALVPSFEAAGRTYLAALNAVANSPAFHAPAPRE